jgi:hypothetical protein
LARTLFDPGIYTIITGGGAIGVGWQLAFYTAGTATPITTYNAPSGGSANANPVDSDGNGRFPQIWIDQGQSVKWVMLDDSGTPKVTVDNVLIAAAPPTIDSSLDSFLDAEAALPVANGGTGAVTGANACVNLGAVQKAGDTVTGNLVRSGKGCHAYFNDAAMTAPIIYITASASSDPRSGNPGEIWLKY